MSRTLTFDEHAVVARASARRHGLADCIHFAPHWERRADALFAFANTLDVAWYRGCSIGLLADGRMAITGDVVSVFEDAVP